LSIFTDKPHIFDNSLQLWTWLPIYIKKTCWLFKNGW